MSFNRKVNLVIESFKELDSKINNFKNETGLKCKLACGECCLYPRIHATILEFIPYAHKMIVQGKAFELLEELKKKELGSSTCIIYRASRQISSHGHCSEYENRGLICRLFGFSANLQKNGIPGMITCSIIKSNHPDFLKNPETILAYSENLPIASEYYFKLQSIDLSLSLRTFPINIAIRKALEYALSCYSYRKFPKQRIKS